MRHVLLALPALAVALIVAACSSSDSTGNSQCDPGTLVFCKCFDDSPGKHECSPNGQGFGECLSQTTGRVCTSPGNSSGTLASGSGGSGGSGGSTGFTCPGKAISVGIGSDAVVQGDTSLAIDTDHASCGGDSAPEVVYAVTPTSSGTLAVTATGIGSTDPVLYARLDDCKLGPQIGCSDKTFDGGIEALLLQATADKTIYVFVDGYSGTEGPFSLRLHLKDGVPGDSCLGNPIDIGRGEVVMAAGDTSVATADYDGTDLCSLTGKEIVYSVKPSSSGLLTVTMNPDYDGMLYARSGSCPSPFLTNQLGCSDAIGIGEVEEISFQVDAGTVYSVFADGFDNESGTYTIQFEMD